MATNQFELADPPSDIISALEFAPEGQRLLVSSWDKHAYRYEIAAGNSTLLQKYEHRAPILSVCWGEGENEAYTGGLDWDVRRLDLTTGDQSILSSHEAGVNSLAFSKEHHLLVSASWDSTLHIHHTKPTGEEGEAHPTTIKLPHKPFSISLTSTKLVVAMAARALHIYDLKSLTLISSQTASASDEIPELSLEPWQRRESSLKFMTRAAACMPNDLGYASSSIEGRVAVEWFDPSPESQARKYAFKCHRQPASDGSGADIVYPVNALAFHPVHGTFASGGGDGYVSLWDGITKRRIKQYQRYAASVAALSFSADGKWLAIAISPGFEDGKEGPDEGAISVLVRELGENEAKGKGAK